MLPLPYTVSAALNAPTAPGAPIAPGAPNAPNAPGAPSAPGAPGAPSAPGSQFSASALAKYRLTPEVFKRFAHATRLIGAAIRRDPRFDQRPLITEDISVAGDAAEMATALQTRLDTEPELNAALFAADISSHEYATFAIALFAARLAYGFVQSGAMRRVPEGVAAENVEFVRANEAAITSLLKQLRLE